MTSKNSILSLNFGGHDCSACLMVNNEIIAACEQERFDLIKHSREFPIEAINECLKIGNIKINDIETLAYTWDTKYLIKEKYLKPALKNDKAINFIISDIEKIKIFNNIKKIIRERTGYNGKIKEVRHHLTHLASAYYPSGFEKALIISNDGVGEIDSTQFAIGDKLEINLLPDNVQYPNSLGLIYSAITFFLGWQHHCDEGIIMGLAGYGNGSKPIEGSNLTYNQLFEDIILTDEDFNYSINQKWISYHKERNVWLSDLFFSICGPKRELDQPVTQHHKNIAAALQYRLEYVMIEKIKKLKKTYKLDYLTIAGGVGLNCSLNGKIYKECEFKEIFIQPASGDAGCTLGACYYVNGKNNKLKKNHNSYLGSRYSDEEIEETLKSNDVKYIIPDDYENFVANQIFKKKIIGWFQGAAEFGPRALGNRSILCSPYPKEMKDYLNNKVKFREDFRPFAPAVLAEKASQFFELYQESSHMLIAVKVNKKMIEKIPAITHIDYTARVQTVTSHNNLKFYKLINAFYKKTNIPVLLNTSFNVKGQPIVNTPLQAIKCFEATNIDCLAIGKFVVMK